MSLITPIANIQTLEQIKAAQGASKTENVAQNPFKEVFKDAISDVIETDKQVSMDVEKLVSGETDDLAGLMVDISKSQLSLSLLIQMRNRGLEAYNEMMRINL